jgi:putative ABC transport system permease protein
VNTILQDIVSGIKTLSRQPRFTIVAVLTLALGIGATVAVFTVVNTVLLRRLPYADPQRLFVIRLDMPGSEGHPGISAPEAIEFRDKSTRIEGLAAVTPVAASLTSAGNMETVTAGSISTNLFTVLGIQPVLGRNLSLSEDMGKASVLNVLISYELWQRRFGGASDVLSRRIEVNNLDLGIAGVMPPRFSVYLGPDTPMPSQVDIWFPNEISGLPTAHETRTVGRLKPGVTLAQAQAEIDGIAARMIREDPQSYGTGDHAFRLVSLHDDIVNHARPAVLALFGAVSFVLLIACANVANLLLARCTVREREWSIRLALGAGSTRIVRQLLIEGFLLSGFGALLGLMLATWGLDLLIALTPINLPRHNDIGVDSTVLVFVLGVSMLSGIGFSLAPAIQLLRHDISSGLKAGGRTITGGDRPRLRTALIAMEVALSFLLLVGAGLMIRTFANLRNLHLGFSTERVLALEMEISGRDFPDVQRRLEFYRTALEKVSTIQGVESASAINQLPLGEWQFTESYALDPSGFARTAESRTVMPGVFKTLGIPMLAGRDFRDDDTATLRPLVIVDERLAAGAWGVEQAVGKQILLRPNRRNSQWAEVIGVVRHVRLEQLRGEGGAQIYLPHHLFPVFGMTVTVRTALAPAVLAPTLRKELESLGGKRPVHRVVTLEEHVARASADTRFELTLLASFGLIALMLCVVGVYGVISYAVSRRTVEIGVRMALGARAGDVIRLITRDVSRPVGIGLGLGIVLAFGLTRFLGNMLFGVPPTDASTFAFVIALVAIAAAAASYIPTRTALRTDPTVALRRE